MGWVPLEGHRELLALIEVDDRERALEEELARLGAARYVGGNTAGELEAGVAMTPGQFRARGEARRRAAAHRARRRAIVEDVLVIAALVILALVALELALGVDAPLGGFAGGR